MNKPTKDPRKKLLRHEDYNITLGLVEVLIKDKVFTPDPEITYSSSLLLKNIPNVEGKKVLDIGCGTGIIGITCLQKGAKEVIFSDISDDALENTKINLQRKNITNNVRIIKSNLFENIDEKIDIIMANLPILDEVRDQEEISKNLTNNFLQNIKKNILPNGEVHMTRASFAEIKPVINTLDTLEYNYSINKEEKMGFTWYHIKICF